MTAPRFRVLSVSRYERDVRFRTPFRFGVVTLTFRQWYPPIG